LCLREAQAIFEGLKVKGRDYIMLMLRDVKDILPLVLRDAN